MFAVGGAVGAASRWRLCLAAAGAAQRQQTQAAGHQRRGLCASRDPEGVRYVILVPCHANSESAPGSGQIWLQAEKGYTGGGSWQQTSLWTTISCITVSKCLIHCCYPHRAGDERQRRRASKASLLPGERRGRQRGLPESPSPFRSCWPRCWAARCQRCRISPRCPNVRPVQVDYQLQGYMSSTNKQSSSLLSLDWQVSGLLPLPPLAVEARGLT